MDYLEGGCNEEVNLQVNQDDLKTIKLMPYYLRDTSNVSLQTTLFGHTYAGPFGMAPVGLQGLIWPNAAQILAKSAVKHNIPFILSTVSTASIEEIASITEGKAWFQLYYPVKKDIRLDLIERAKAAGCPVLVVLADVPAFGYRPKEIRNGLALPPKLHSRAFIQTITRSVWGINTLRHGIPEFKTVKKYLPGKLKLSHLGAFMNETFDGRLTIDRLKELRDLWPGKLVVKGLVSEEDTEKIIQLGYDGLIVSNHGGRQLDAGESTIRPLQRLANQYGDKITIMMDSGVRGGPDIARAMACGARFVFMGRPWMYGVAALGENGGHHTINLMKKELEQVLQQLGCQDPSRLPEHLINAKT